MSFTLEELRKGAQNLASNIGFVVSELTYSSYEFRPEGENWMIRAVRGINKKTIEYRIGDSYVWKVEFYDNYVSISVKTDECLEDFQLSKSGRDKIQYKRLPQSDLGDIVTLLEKLSSGTA